MDNSNKSEATLINDMTVDLLVVGSGTGLSAALAGNEIGLKSLVIEKTAHVGGSTALSGGAFWIPANPILKAEGSNDHLEKAEQYLDTLVKDDAPRDRWKSFLVQGSAAVEMLQRTTPMKFFWSKGYSDYHPEEPGGDAEGRTCECRPFNIKRLGKDLSNFRPGLMASSLPMPVTGYDYKWMNLMMRKPLKAFPIIFKRLLQGVGGMLLGKKLVAGGQALAAGLYAGALEADIPVVTNAELVELIVDEKRVTGAVVEQNGRRISIKVTRGVVLAAGGFDHNMPMRQRYQSESLVDDLSFGAEGNTGDAIELSQEMGADIDLMKQAWWFPAVAPTKPGENPQVLLAERSLPGSFMVNSKGQRFINEAINYMSFGQKVLEYEEKGNPVGDMWLVFDQTYRNRYLLAGSVFPRSPLPDEWYEAGIAHSADSPAALAKSMGLPEKDFMDSFNRFNQMAEEGKDKDFQRGESAYDRYYGDPTIKPNPNLLPLKGKLYAVKVVLSDLGTCGGLVADEHGRVLREDKSVIEGLYAIGNTAANIFGKTYPGAGGTICQGLVYGYIVAQHAAAKESVST
ncbi:3-ketosteroid-delta-1-dehydrogenase [Membranicola marinus]|uniref:3-ketosteroid-delta-1-dehydrogenase n=1 Tax=Membranihabitans marinus TaxID=1227546 RepID=A0A953L9M4_9BACT|nr:3-ketosteroid-delta-1-dehydrogenase [Membranihabitans marinus]MBY5958995.1 3-ketosteroid-delta-1-dehydrogenase [Membranihabitans marinus]